MTRSILVIASHPAMQHSRATSKLVSAVADLDFVTIHDLYQQYPDFFIDVAHEQQLLIMHEIIVFQHPVYWYSCPALMKEWIDVVLEYNFAYGAQGKQLAGKIWLSVVTTGGTEQAYADDSATGHTFDMLFLPFRRTAQLCSMHYHDPVIYYGIAHKSDDEIIAMASAYRDVLIKLSDPS